MAMTKNTRKKTEDKRSKIAQKQVGEYRLVKSSRHLSLLYQTMFILILVSGCTNLPTRVTSKIDTPLYLEEIIVEIHGAVKAPGTYTLEKKARLRELISKAEGLEENADVSGLNMNQVLSHHDIIVIEEIQEVVKISINTGGVEQLQKLPGIGPKTAQAIVQYRETHGFFQAIEELDRVKGIGIKKLEKLRDYIKL